MDPRPDSEIVRVLRTALEWDVFVPAGRIQWTVTHGIVTLAGKVNLLCERVDAERAIQFLVGVRQVINEIEVAPINAGR